MIKVQAGDRFIANIYGKCNVEGVIQIEGGRYYLCQNDCEGSNCKDKLGYKYSWIVENFSDENLKYMRVENFILLSNRKSRIEKLNI